MLWLQYPARCDCAGVPGKGTFFDLSFKVIMVFLRTFLLAGFLAIALSSFWTGGGVAVDAPSGCEDCTAFEASPVGPANALVQHPTELAGDQTDPDVADTPRVRTFTAYPVYSQAGISLHSPDPLAVLLRPPWAA
jgi:hypothetical protein